jgi:hypothetical protein
LCRLGEAGHGVMLDILPRPVLDSVSCGHCVACQCACTISMPRFQRETARSWREGELESIGRLPTHGAGFEHLAWLLGPGELFELSAFGKACSCEAQRQNHRSAWHLINNMVGLSPVVLLAAADSAASHAWRSTVSSAATGSSKASLARLAGAISSLPPPIVPCRRACPPVPMRRRPRRPRHAWSCLFNRSTGLPPLQPPRSAPGGRRGEGVPIPPEPLSSLAAEHGGVHVGLFPSEERDVPSGRLHSLAPISAPPAPLSSRPPVRAHTERHPASFDRRADAHACTMGWKWANIPKWVLVRKRSFSPACSKIETQQITADWAGSSSPAWPRYK